MSLKTRLAKMERATGKVVMSMAPSRRCREFPWGELSLAELKWIGRRVESLTLPAEQAELRAMSDEELDARLAAINAELSEIDAAKGLPRGTTLEARDLQLAQAIVAEAGLS